MRARLGGIVFFFLKKNIKKGLSFSSDCVLRRQAAKIRSRKLMQQARERERDYENGGIISFWPDLIRE